MPGINVGGMSIGMATDGCCSVPATPTPSNVLACGMFPMIVPNIYGWHPCGDEHCSHAMFCASGYPKVLINGRPVVVDGSPLSCGVGSVGVQNVRCGG